MTSGLRPGRHRGSVWIVALLAYVPLLLTAPGRVPADTKLYLYLSPGRLLTQAPLTWDTSQFGGWVPHQIIAYLWPQGPWYWVLDAVGVPDWIAHRLWVGTLLLLAALGVRWTARQLGIRHAAATAAGVVYMLSPYVLAYLSRTTAMLLPWAALGWIVGLTIRSAHSSSNWRHPALLALVLFSCSAVNATAVLMIAPAPILWMIHAGARGEVPWRRLVATAARIGTLALAVSAWWVAMVSVQGRHGADVLAFSESLEATSFTTLASEVLRGTGYWLFYVRDSVAFATTASRPYQEDVVLVALSYVLPLLGVAGLVVIRWAGRRFAALLVVAGMILAVGVHPISDPSPLMSGIAENSRSGLALALRSSARATPMVVLGLALALAALLEASASRRGRPARLVAALGPATVILVAVASLPSLVNGGAVDPSLSRDQDPPAAWNEAASLLDDGSDEYRVMQLPGSEFGAFGWGFTVDPPQPGLMSRPFLTRDLLPLGSPAMMDLQYALDDRVQDGSLVPESIAPVARLLGVDTLWLAADLDWQRYGSTPPDDVIALVETAQGVGPVDTRRGEVALAAVEDPVSIMRVGEGAVYLVGSGDGIIDAAAAGLLSGTEALVASATVTAPPATGSWDAVVLTDSNRDRAHHWRGSQDVWGMTGTGGPQPETTRADESDQRFDLRGDGSEPLADEQTIAWLEDTGGVRRDVVASGYGRPFSFLPERRAAMAVDGDPTTAWTVAEGGDPVGQSLVVETDTATLLLLQPTEVGGTVVDRRISRVRVDDGARSVLVDLDERSWNGAGQPVTLAAPGRVTLTIESVVDLVAADPGTSGVGFAELGVGPYTEVVRLPLAEAPTAAATAVVMTRLRVGADQADRADPEPALVREFSLPIEITPAQWSVLLRPSGGGVARLPGCDTSLLTIDGRPVGLEISSDAAERLSSGLTADVAVCSHQDNRLTLAPGVHRLVEERTDDVVIDRVVIDSGVRTAIDAQSTQDGPTSISDVRRTALTRSAQVGPTADGSWFVLGEGWNPAWRATADGVDLGTPVPMSGGGNGWWIAPSDSPTTVVAEWTAQTGVTTALLVTLVAVLLCGLLAARRSRDVAPQVPLAPAFVENGLGLVRGPIVGRLRLVAIATAATAVTALVASPSTATLALAAWLPAAVLGRPRLAGLLSLAGTVLAAAAVVARQAMNHYSASPLWPLAFERLHRPLLAAVVVIVAAAVAEGDT